MKKNFWVLFHYPALNDGTRAKNALQWYETKEEQQQAVQRWDGRDIFGQLETFAIIAFDYGEGEYIDEGNFKPKGRRKPH